MQFLSSLTSDGRRYSRFRNSLWEEYDKLINKSSINPQNELSTLLSLSAADLGTRRESSDGIQIFTPRQLLPILLKITEYPAIIAAFMLNQEIHTAAKLLGLPYSLGGDLMMSLEGIKAIAPERVSVAAEILAVAICFSPSLSLARSNFRDLGQPYTPAWLSQSDFQKLEKAGFIREPIEQKSGRVRLLQDIELRDLVGQKLKARNAEVAQIIVN